MAIGAALLRESRLALWDRLIRGEHVASAECRKLLARLAHDASAEERAGCVVLLAAVCLASEASRAMRRNLRAALCYWFSQTGTKDRPQGFDPRVVGDGGLESVIGLYLSWPEAMISVGANPKDYTAMERLTKQLRRACVDEWERQFGSPAPDELLERR